MIKKSIENARGKSRAGLLCFLLAVFFSETGKSRRFEGMQSRKTSEHPIPTVDLIVSNSKDEVALIERVYPPHGWALPGGFVDPGESCETAAMREGLEELSIAVTLTGQLGTYSEPARDPRMHTLSVVFIAKPTTSENLRGADDARRAEWFSRDTIPWDELCFDHGQILQDYWTRMEICPRCGGNS